MTKRTFVLAVLAAFAVCFRIYVYLANRNEKEALQEIASLEDNVLGLAADNQWWKIPDSGRFYIRLKIEETKIEKRARFSIKEIELIYDKVDRSALIYREDPFSGDRYVLETFDGAETLMETFSAHSATYIFWDGMGDNGLPAGGMIGEGHLVDEITLPFYREDPIVFVKIGFPRDKKRKLIPLPLEVIEQRFKEMEFAIQKAREMKRREPKE